MMISSQYIKTLLIKRVINIKRHGSKIEIRVCVSIKVSVGVRGGVRVRFSVVASGWSVAEIHFFRWGGGEAS
jgi:uncharacterized membrane protein